MDPNHHQPSNVFAVDGYTERKGGHTKAQQCDFPVPIAIIGMACRLPGHSMSPRDLWEFLKDGKVADITPPANRFRLQGHHDGSQKPYTMKTPGAMFMEDVDPAAFDAQFFQINASEASSMDPQQRVLMEVAYECLENAGIPKEQIDGTRMGCIVGASAVDYHDMDCRDPEDRTDSPTMGCGRALLSNRISHFLNVHGPSITVDTACSSGLTALQLACLYLRSSEADSMLVGGVNMYFSPERNQDMGAMRETASSTGYCHSFDTNADGYVIAEAVNSVLLKRLDDAIRDGDPIRAVIRGVAVNSAGKTAGIAMPSPKAQESVIRDAYRVAGIPNSDISETGYVECHGTGTRAGDPAEIEGLAAVFRTIKSSRDSIVIGSIKSNIGHSEAAAGLSSIIKATLSIENGLIPGTPSFRTPNPTIDFDRLGFKVSRTAIPWPKTSKLRASINSFGFGGANAHAVLESPKYLLPTYQPKHRSCFLTNEDIDGDFFLDDCCIIPTTPSARPYLLVLSANDEESLRDYAASLVSCLVNPAVQASTLDLAYTMSERRSLLRHRAFAVIRDTCVKKDTFTFVKRLPETPVLAFTFTGQGAQWPTMGKSLLTNHKEARETLKRLDAALMHLPQPPDFSLFEELTLDREPSALRRPELSQPLITALQVAYVNVLSAWGIRPSFVVGHSSGEIAAAYTAGYLSEETAIKIAYLRGVAVQQTKDESQLGMLAVGLPAEVLREYIKSDDNVQIACRNSASSTTVSGSLQGLELLQKKLQNAGHFTRLLQVDVAYHSDYMLPAASVYKDLICRAGIDQPCQINNGANIRMFSSVTGAEIGGPPDVSYWQRNLVAEVNFDSAVCSLLQTRTGPNIFIEIGPSNTLSGPIQESFRTVQDQRSDLRYTSVAKRNQDMESLLYELPGIIIGTGGSVDVTAVNGYTNQKEVPHVLIDLPNYAWNHSEKYWKESLASQDWRQRKFIKHDLLGSKILGTTWSNPTWRNTIRIQDLPWLMDHKIGDQVVFPASGYICMAIEAMYQANTMSIWKGVTPDNCVFRLRDAKFSRALVLSTSESTTINLTLAPFTGSMDSWYEFRVSSMKSDVWTHHASGLVRIESSQMDFENPTRLMMPLQHPMSTKEWYYNMQEIGMNFGPAFQKHLAVEHILGDCTSRSMVSLVPPGSKWQQSRYLLHPACMDGCFQATSFVLGQARFLTGSAAMVPFALDEMTLPFPTQQTQEATVSARFEYNGVGRQDTPKSYSLSCYVADPETGSLLLELNGLRLTEVDSSRALSSLHTFTGVHWDADINYLSVSDWRRLEIETTAGPSSPCLDRARVFARKLVQLAAHKKPDLQVLEINLESQDPSSLLLDQNDANETKNSQPVRLSRYQYYSSDANTVATIAERHGSDNRTEYAVHNFESSSLADHSGFDVALIRLLPGEAHNLPTTLRNVHSSLGKACFVLIVAEDSMTKALEPILSEAGFDTIVFLEIGVLCISAEVPSQEAAREVTIVKFDEQQIHPLELALRNSECSIRYLTPKSDIKRRDHILILDDPETTVMTRINDLQFEMLQKLVRSECNILWVTRGAQMRVDNPDSAIAHGLLRVMRNENPGLNLISLDVESFCNSSSLRAVEVCLGMLYRDSLALGQDSEFVERGGILHIGRILPDSQANSAVEENQVPSRLCTLKLQDNSRVIQLRAEQIGNLDSLHYQEVSSEPPNLEGDRVEIKVEAAGVNFKDVAITLGLIPENEYLLGGEGSGIVTRVAPGVTDVKPGQRVAFFERGSFGNTATTITKLLQVIPDTMSFAEAATIPCAFMTSMYCLFTLGEIKAGDTVLIHSATGGVGIAAIQLCQYIGATVYATVGSQEKQDFLLSTFGIPRERIFSSRNRAFAKQILDHTQGRGVDIILNSLTGDLLDESWRIIAEGGTMVEIGKKDILNQGLLSMSPFKRNATFRSFDLSHKEMDDDRKGRLLSEVFRLLRQGSLKPISPIHQFSFTEIPAALRHIGSGKHIGKLVITDNDNNSEVSVPVRLPRASIKLRGDAAYLVVGGLRGLCGTIALSLAMNGATQLVVMSRSRQDDPVSQKVKNDLQGCGCTVTFIQGDVTILEDVRRAFEITNSPIRGVIQGAMVLRDRIFDSMKVHEFYEALNCKVRGTWNIHNVSLEQPSSLDFFTLLSSVSGICGNKGQANYASANTFLDAFAAYRQRLGLNACSISLGVINHRGYLAEHQTVRDSFDSAIWHGIGEKLLGQILESSIQRQEYSPENVLGAAHIITGIQFPQPKESHLLYDARFSGLLSRESSVGKQQPTDGSQDVRALLLALRSKADAKTVSALVMAVCERYLVKSLRLSGALDPTRPLSDYGVDSLVTVEFRGYLRVHLGVELSTLEVLNASSLVSICKTVLERIEH
ncbi:hypothetical protein PFICI_15056 [Pestalotiopsis fici W106-1]|uniref:Uncharacterized protein n=1 Tax=Pestalotiopsis fici (strain W106-1 / CGMCC3.15140) TaxID=1229662 RepID=W3WKV6_PESFW|nr:uncharacterized protein PFICI_15056 [Pestalotiopsis fici W106-1]ETS73451.1 hypothetical protein PFICI_15056 [Pestalotiopsis fici W106-1]